MIGQDADGPTGTFVSPPCSIHELNPAYLRVSDALDPRQRPGVKRWRKAERVRRIKHRLAIATKTHRQHDTRIQKVAELGWLSESWRALARRQYRPERDRETPHDGHAFGHIKGAPP